MRRVLQIICAWGGLAVFLVLGVGFLPLTLWNVAPFVAGFGVVEGISKWKGRGWAKTPLPWKACAIGAVVGLTGPSLMFLLAWGTDYQHTRSGSSTSAIAFLLIPLWSIAFGSVAATLGLLAGYVTEKLKP